MAFSVVMPALEMAQETGKLLAWRKQEGDPVTKGEPLLEIETDKAVVEVEAPADGVLAGIKAVAGADIPVGQTIAWIVAPGETPPAESASPIPVARASSHAKTEPSHAVAVSASGSTQSSPSRAKVSPKARRLAKELGVNLATVRGSGAGGEILASDVQASTAPPAAAGGKKSESIEVPSTLARIMAERTTASWTTIPHFFVSREIEATALNEYRERIAAEIERSHQVRITHTDLLVALVARVLLKHPRLNASWSTEGIRLYDHVNMGMAAWSLPRFPTRTPQASLKLPCSGAISPSARVPESCGLRIFPALLSPSAISACIRSISSAQSSHRHKPPFSPSAASPTAWWS
jgi:pyruvate dehydrogenase E2 component (dihydrolipoamide acetyltransferase)